MEGTVSPASTNLTCECPAQIQFLEQNPDLFRVLFDTPGLYFFTAGVTGSLGGTYTITADNWAGRVKAEMTVFVIQS